MSQPGIYAESDMEFQDMFFEAQIAKYKGDTEGQVAALNKVIKRDKNSHAAYYELSRAYKLSCLLYTSPSPRDATLSRMPSSA